MNDSSTTLSSFRDAASAWLQHGMEGVVLLLVGLSPWFFGCVDPAFEFWLFAGVALLGVLWGLRSVADGYFLWFACPVALTLILIVGLGFLQLVPLPGWVLSVVSPTAARFNDELRPEQPEVIVAGQPPASHRPAPTTSVYPGATRPVLLRMLAVLVLYAVVRTNVASSESLRRLAWLAVLNGVALALFGLVQFVQSQRAAVPTPRNVFGYETRGDVFGPFICRNHFAYYANMCIGLAIGLLLMSGRSESDKRARRTHKAQALVEQNADDEPTLSVLNILQSPMQLWLLVGVAVMVCGVVGSMSRGGVIALIAALLAAIALRGMKGLKAARLDLLVIPALLVAGLAAWVGIKPLESRLAMRTGDLTTDGRLQIWRNLAPAAARFAVTGSGYGTLPFVEPVYRQRDYQGYNATVDIDHAHNEYLEALVEGGVPRLVMTVTVVLLLFNYARKAMRRHEVRSPGRLAFGALVGVAAVAFHNVVDFGLHTPAVAVLAAVLAAQLCCMARSDPSGPPTERSKHTIAVSVGGWGGWLAAIALLAVGFILVQFASRNAQAYRQRLSAFQALQVKPPNADVAIAALTRAVRISPDDALLRLELGQLYLDTLALRSNQPSATRPSAQALFDSFTKPALEQIIVARDLCPLLPRAQARLAGYAHDARPEGGITMAKSDPSAAYWQRAAFLAPYDSDLLYFAGKWHLQANQFEEAYALWRRSLERRPLHLKAIIAAAAPRLGPDGLIEKVLPNRPAYLIEAAKFFDDQPDRADAQRRLLLRAKQDLLDLPYVDADSSHTLAQTYRMLGETAQATAAYRQAVALAPGNAEWHYEFAEFLYSLSTDAGRREAAVELERVLQISPNSTPASNLLAAIKAELKSP